MGIILCYLVVFSSMHFVQAADHKMITLKIGSAYIRINGVNKSISKGKQVMPSIENDTTLIPIKAVVEALGGKFFWKSKDQEIMIDFGKHTIFMRPGEKKIVVNTVTKELQIAPILVEDTIMVPLEFVTEFLECAVDWNKEAKTIKITKVLLDENEKKEKIDSLKSLWEEAQSLQKKSDVNGVKEKYYKIIENCDVLLTGTLDRVSIGQAYAYKALALKELKEEEKAKAFFIKAIAMADSLTDKESINHKEQIGEIYYYWAAQQMVQGNKTEAIENIKKAIKKDLIVFLNKFKDDPIFASLRNTDDYYNVLRTYLVIDDLYTYARTLMKEGILLSEYKEVACAAGAMAKWEESTQTITLTKLGKTIIFQVGRKSAKVDGKEIALVTAPVVLDGYDQEKFFKDAYILIPVEFTAKQFEQEVTWGEIEVYKGLKQPAIILRESLKNVKYTEQQRKWAVAPSANIYLYNHGVYHTMGGVARDTARVLSVKTSIEDGWGIYSREDYFETAEWLRSSGHNSVYRQLEKEIEKMSQQEVEDMMKNSEYGQYRIDFHLKNKGALKDKGLIAWDYARIIQITGYTYVSGYLTIEEAYDICIEASKTLQKTYSSWEDFAEHYMLGYEFWSAQSRQKDGTEASKRHKLNQRILNDAKSPWSTLPWNLPLD